MDLITIGLSPDTFPEDLRLAFRLLLRPGQWQEGEATRASQEFFFDSGRSALLTLLQAFGIRQEDEVLLQAFTCAAVPNAILWAGAKPVYVDIEKETLNLDINDLEAKITPCSKAVIVQHTFGLPAKVSEVAQIAQKHNLIVIEDCAHALGAQYQGKRVGSFGDAAFFSFGRDKVVSSVFGGKAVINSKLETRNSKLDEIYRRLNYPSNAWIGQQLLHPLLSEAVLKSYNLGLGRVLHFALKNLGILSRANTNEEKKLAQKPNRIPSKMPNALMLLLNKQLERLEMFNRHRSEIAQKYLAADIQSVQPDTIDHIWLRFPILVEDPGKFHAFAKKNGIILGDWYNQVIGPEDVNLNAIGYKMGFCPVAEEVSKRIVNLPTCPRMTDSQVEKVVEMFHAIFHS